MINEYIIDDSAQFPNSHNYIGKEFSVRVGMVRQRVYVQGSRETRYAVEVIRDSGAAAAPITCTRAYRFGGLYNFEEYTYRGFEPGDSQVSYGNAPLVPGDMVIVACINGNSREGIILGCLKHRGRDEILDSADNDTAFISEFNGLETIINANGEYRVTYKGLPTNIDELNNPPSGSPYPAAEYDENKGFSYFQFDSDGSYTLTDNANDDLPQSIIVDKKAGTIELISGKTAFVIDKNKESYTIQNKITTFNAADEFNIMTKVTNVDSSQEVNVTSGKINTTGELTQEGNVTIKGNTDQSGNVNINGNLTTTGQTSLAGGNFPLVYDVIISKGTGNKGAPVISQILLKKTTQTKAT